MTSTEALQRGIYSAQVMTLLRSLINHNLGLESDNLLLNTSIWKGISYEYSMAQGGKNLDMDAFLGELIVGKLDLIKSR